MKNRIPIQHLLVFLLAITTSMGCKQTRILVYDTDSENIQQKDKQWVADNDTLLIAYSFWAEGGKLSCVIFNKTERQLFIDWKSSAFIVNDRKVEFWNDAVQYSSNTRGRSVAYQESRTTQGNDFNWDWLTRSISAQSSYAITSGTMVTNERITSIPPKSYIGLERFTLFPEMLFPSGPTTETILEPSQSKANQQETVTRTTYDVKSSPLRFRVFLTYAFTEDMRTPYSVNNSFWLCSTSDMAFRHFEGKLLSRSPDGTPTYEKPLKNRRSFYWRYTK